MARKPVKNLPRCSVCNRIEEDMAIARDGRRLCRIHGALCDPYKAPGRKRS